MESAVERLSDDETLRGNLTDAGFAPLFAMVSNLAITRGKRFGSTDELYTALRRLLVSSAEAAQNGDPAALLASAVPPLVDESERAVLKQDIQGLQGTADEIAVGLARALARATHLDFRT